MIYDCDYDAHPDYGGSLAPYSRSERSALIAEFEGIRASSREKMIREMAPLGYGAEPTALAESWWYPYLSEGEADNPALGQLLRDGIAAFRLDPEKKQALLDVSAPFIERIHEMRRQPGHRSGPDNKVRIGMPTRAPEHRPLLGVLRELFDAHCWDKLAMAYFGSPSVTVTSAIFKVSGRGDNDWEWGLRGFEDKRPPGRGRGLHIDAGCYFDMKVIIYLSEVTDAADGAFNYCLGSHLDAPGFDDLCIRNAVELFCGATPRREEQRRRFLSLPSDYRKKIDFGVDLQDDSEAMSALLGTEKTYLSDEADTVFFDTRGVHRGGYVERGERAILQLTLRAQA